MINSTAFPKETLIKAPGVSPTRCAALSVAVESRPAKGTIATAFIAKMMVGFTRAILQAIPIGTKTKRMLAWELNKIFLKAS